VGVRQRFTYDDAGNLTKDDKYNYEWDQEGRLLKVTNQSGSELASYTYHPDGLRKTKTVGASTYQYHYDGSNLIRMTDQSKATLWTITWANGKPVSFTNKAGVTYFYITNYRGDVVQIVDQNGLEAASYSYDPWGNVLSTVENAEVTNQPLGYASYVYDRGTKLYYLQARYYDPETARFISRDPDPGDSDDPKTQNGYTYADNNPGMLTDPDGHYAQLVIYGGVAAYRGYKLYKSYKSIKKLNTINKVVKKTKGTGKISAKDVVFSDKFKKTAYKNQVAERGWTNESIAKVINNPFKTTSAVNKYTNNSVTVYYKDKTHYVAVDNGTGKVIQVSNLNKSNWKFDPDFSK
jgi:RHS repeat-associated protein